MTGPTVKEEAVKGKPLETVGRKAIGAKAVKAAKLAGLRSKPRETAGRKAMGAKAHTPLTGRRYASPAAG